MKKHDRKQEKINFCREIKLDYECTEDMDWYESENYSNYQSMLEIAVKYFDEEARKESTFWHQAWQDIIFAKKIQVL